MRNIGIIAKLRFTAVANFVLQEESMRMVVKKQKSTLRKDWQVPVLQKAIGVFNGCIE